MAFWLSQTVYGLSFGMILFVLAAGLTLIYGLMNIINMVHGSFYLVAAYLAISLAEQTHSYLWAMLAPVAAVTVVGLVIQWFFLSRFYRDELNQALVSLGFLFIMAAVCFWIWGGTPQALSEPAWLAGSVRLAGVTVTDFRLAVIALGAVMALALWLLLERTTVGAMVRAGMDDSSMAQAIGINIPVVFAAVYAVGAALAGVGGAVGAAILGAYPGADFDVTLLAFVVVIVGGIGSLRGALIAGLLIGFVDSLGKVLFPALAPFLIFGSMAAILVVRPHGLFGQGR